VVFEVCAQKRAPCLASEIVLFSISFVSRREAAGDAGSPGYALPWAGLPHSLLRARSQRSRSSPFMSFCMVCLFPNLS